MFNSSLQFDFDDTAAQGEETVAPATLTNASIASGLERIADLLEGGSQAQAKREALRRAAAVIRFSTRSTVTLVSESGVEGVHGLGIPYELSGIVTDWVRSGRLEWLEVLQSRRRRELVALPGIGPKLANELKAVLGVVDLEGLVRAAREGQLARVWGFGPKRVQMIEAMIAGR